MKVQYSKILEKVLRGTFNTVKKEQKVLSATFSAKKRKESSLRNIQYTSKKEKFQKEHQSRKKFIRGTYNTVQKEEKRNIKHSS